MRFGIVAAWALAGLMAGGLAGSLIKPGGYGLLADLLLGLAGSLVGTVVFHALATFPETGWLVMPVVPFVGAASMILGQRWWYTHV